MVVKVPADYRELALSTIAISHQPLPPHAPPHLQRQAITTVTLNRPSRLNAFTNDMAIELEAVFNILSRDDRVRVIVLTGAGRAFCAGADLNAGSLESYKSLDEHRDE